MKKTTEDVMREIHAARAIESARRVQLDAESDAFMRGMMDQGLVDGVTPSNPNPPIATEVTCAMCGTRVMDEMSPCPSCGNDSVMIVRIK